MTRPKEPYQKICNFCRKPFEAYQKRTLYCGHTCNRRAYKEGVRLKKHTKIEDGEVVKKTSISTNILLEEILAGVLSINKQLLLVSKPYLTPKEVCSFLSMGRRTFDRMIQEGTIKTHLVGKGKLYVKRSDLDLLFETHP